MRQKNIVSLNKNENIFPESIVILVKNTNCSPAPEGCALGNLAWACIETNSSYNYIEKNKNLFV
jgi:hypothetical protein